MGKSLIIKGADFSANGIQEDLSLDITSLVSSCFYARKAIGSLNGAGVSDNAKRCCVCLFDFAEQGLDLSPYSKIVMTVKNGFDYVFATGSGSTWTRWDGATAETDFTWATDNQVAEATIDANTGTMNANFRYDDNTTEFPTTTELTDIVESIVLVP